MVISIFAVQLVTCQGYYLKKKPLPVAYFKDDGELEKEKHHMEEAPYRTELRDRSYKCKLLFAFITEQNITKSVKILIVT